MFEFDLLVVDWWKRELSTGWNVQHGKVPSRGGGAVYPVLRHPPPTYWPLKHRTDLQIQNKNGLMFVTNTKKIYYYNAIRYNIFISNPKKKKKITVVLK